jgi:hypothetical protein
MKCIETRRPSPGNRRDSGIEELHPAGTDHGRPGGGTVRSPETPWMREDSVRLVQAFAPSGPGSGGKGGPVRSPAREGRLPPPEVPFSWETTERPCAPDLRGRPRERDLLADGGPTPSRAPRRPPPGGLVELGVDIATEGTGGVPPSRCGAAAAGRTGRAEDLDSSQYVSSLLISAPTLPRT